MQEFMIKPDVSGSTRVYKIMFGNDEYARAANMDTALRLVNLANIGLRFEQNPLKVDATIPEDMAKHFKLPNQRSAEDDDKD